LQKKDDSCVQENETLGDFLNSHKYSQKFQECYVVCSSWKVDSGLLDSPKGLLLLLLLLFYWILLHHHLLHICFQLVQDQFFHITNGKVVHFFLHICFQLVQDQFFHTTNGEVMLSFLPCQLGIVGVRYQLVLQSGHTHQKSYLGSQPHLSSHFIGITISFRYLLNINSKHPIHM
jgi:hypothetical protein